ncbi:hypothetical protein BDV18DRAFT_161967 [Aspergillus unguis]
MMSKASVFDILRRRVRRQQEQPTDVQEVPDLCYDVCTYAARIAQQTGRTPSLCAADSSFMNSYETCTTCITVYTTGDAGNGTSANETISFLSGYINYCNNEGNGTDIVDIKDLLASWSSLEQSQSQIVESLASAGVDVTTTTTSQNATATTTTGTSGAVPSETGNAADSDPSSAAEATAADSSSSSDNIGVIVPAVVVPVVCVLGAVVIAWVLLRRRKKRRELEAAKTDTDSNEGKAQLHADEFRPELSGTAAAEMATDRDEGFVAELPARELVGSELDARGREI